MIPRHTPPFRTANPPQWRGACAAVAGGGPNRATAIVVARLVFTISGQSRAFTTLRLIDLVTIEERNAASDIEVRHSFRPRKGCAPCGGFKKRRPRPAGQAR